MHRPHVLLILDGFGLSLETKGNAVAMARLPHLRYLSHFYPGTALQSSGIAVGIMWGEVGNSEVGHSNIGAGTVIYQHLPRVNLAIEDKTFFDLPVWKDAVAHATKNNSAIHLAGLLSNGGVHAHIDHLFALLRAIKQLGFFGKVFVHAFTDGRDVPPQSAPLFFDLLNKEIAAVGLGEIASVSGRYLGMDRAAKWDRTKRAYDAIIGKGEKNADDIQAALDGAYKENISDEVIPGTTIVRDGTPIGAVHDNDALLFWNFRPDRMRQLLLPFVDPMFKEFPRTAFKNLFIATMTEYDETLPAHIAFPSQHIAEPLAKVIADAGLRQIHIAEKEKYAHITYFLNGGREEPFEHEDRVIVPSAANVTDYDQKPEMSAREIADKVIEAIRSKQYDFVAVNFANGDMVGHTGNISAAIIGLEVIDECVGTIMNETLNVGGVLYVTADHGNCEEMINLENDEADTEHSTNPVPFWIAASDNKRTTPANPVSTIITRGISADVAPTIIAMMGLKKPKAMTGTSLIKVIGQLPLP
ncbi:MAG: 2,3-bisphosphoglycerate-independent phosphoglycerate mutase [bacterium]|nr:2,3-bisphosphoglycerate-independent phosphoglycerate mutase [bacterium]